MLTLAAIALVAPAAFRAASGATADGLGKLSISIAVVLLLVYLLYLTFTMGTHSAPEEGEAHAPPWDVRRSALVLPGQRR